MWISAGIQITPTRRPNTKALRQEIGEGSIGFPLSYLELARKVFGELGLFYERAALVPFVSLFENRDWARLSTAQEASILRRRVVYGILNAETRSSAIPDKRVSLLVAKKETARGSGNCAGDEDSPRTFSRRTLAIGDTVLTVLGKR